MGMHLEKSGLYKILKDKQLQNAAAAKSLQSDKQLCFFK